MRKNLFAVFLIAMSVSVHARVCDVYEHYRVDVRSMDATPMTLGNLQSYADYDCLVNESNKTLGVFAANMPALKLSQVVV